MTDSEADNASASTGTRRSGPVGGQIGAFDSEVQRRPHSLTCLNSQEQIGPAGQIPGGKGESPSDAAYQMHTHELVMRNICRHLGCAQPRFLLRR